MAFAPSGCSESVDAARRPMRRIPRAPRHPRDAGKEKRYDPRLPDFKIPCGCSKAARTSALRNYCHRVLRGMRNRSTRPQATSDFAVSSEQGVSNVRRRQ
jgi:hypothetical protein